MPPWVADRQRARPGRAGVQAAIYHAKLRSPVLCLDFVNTVDLRRSLRVEQLNNHDDLVVWAAGHEALGEGYADALVQRARRDLGGADAALRHALALRESLSEVVSSAVRREDPPASDLETVNAALAAHASPPRLVPAAGRLELRWGAEDSIEGPILRSAAELLSGPELARVRECPGSPGKACGWLFIDRTKNGNRVWCVGTLCGNRTRAHRRYRRERQERSASAEPDTRS